MVFSYYNRLTMAQKRIYRRSDQMTSIRLPTVDHVQPIVAGLARALAGGDKAATATAAQALTASLTAALKVSPLKVHVLDVRPSRSWGELHGLYTGAESHRSARVTLWMRTAKRQNVVAFRTFLRTLVHELCHHLDYELLDLEESFHTEGFYKRESSLVHQIANAQEDRLAPV